MVCQAELHSSTKRAEELVWKVRFQYRIDEHAVGWNAGESYGDLDEAVDN